MVHPIFAGLDNMDLYILDFPPKDTGTTLEPGVTLAQEPNDEQLVEDQAEDSAESIAEDYHTYLRDIYANNLSNPRQTQHVPLDNLSCQLPMTKDKIPITDGVDGHYRRTAAGQDGIEPPQQNQVPHRYHTTLSNRARRLRHWCRTHLGPKSK
jgi:hypothetical protein